jgi:hypothetical protein
MVIHDRTVDQGPFRRHWLQFILGNSGIKGHISRGVGNEDRVSLLIPLAEE